MSELDDGEAWASIESSDNHLVYDQDDENIALSSNSSPSMMSITRRNELGSSLSDGSGRWGFLEEPILEKDQIVRTVSDQGIVMEHWEVMNGVKLPPRRSRVLMVENILEVIKESVVGFKPSRSLGMLKDLEEGQGIDIENLAAEIDLTISGGGLKGYYCVGAVHVLLRHLHANNIGIRRVSGTSAGAWIAVFVLCELSVSHWLETYYALQRNPTQHIVDVYREVWFQWMRHVIPPDTYKKVSGRLFIHVTKVTPFGIKEHVISQFNSNDEIFEACAASSQIPYVTSKKVFASCRGENYLLDGGLMNNCPVFKDYKRRQLVIKIMDVEYVSTARVFIPLVPPIAYLYTCIHIFMHTNITHAHTHTSLIYPYDMQHVICRYPFRLLVSANDSCIESLAVRGGMVMKQFLEGGVHSESLAWIQSKTDTPASKWRGRGRFIRDRIITPAVILVFIVYRNTGLRDLKYFFSEVAKGDSDSVRDVVPVHGIKDAFSTNTVGHVFSTVANAVTTVIRDWLM